MSYSRVVGAGLLFSLCLLCPIVAWADSASLAADIRAIIAKKNALSKLPYAANAVTKFKRSYSRPGNLRRKDVSGTAPTLASIPGSDISELFWREGVIDALASGQPNPEACGEFHAGQQDGESGGLGACHLTESVGRAFEDLVSSETSQCYMKNFPTEANLRAGAVVPVSGEFPNGKISQIFSMPEGSADRIVKVNISGDEDQPPQGDQGSPGGTIYLKVSSAAKNRTSRSIYNVEIWHCAEAQPMSIDTLRISSSGIFTSQVAGIPEEEQGSFSVLVSGPLTIAGSKLKWDPSEKRRVIKHFDNGSEFFKANILIGPTIISKSYDSTGGSFNKNYSVSRFSGTNVTNLRFLTGAYKGQSDSHFFLGATAFRDTYYAAEPGSPLKSEVEDFSFEADEFFSSTEVEPVDLSQYDCSAAPDIELNLDMSNPAMQAVRQKCEAANFRNMHFCHDSEDVRMADENFRNIC